MTEAERAAAQAIFAEQVKTYEARLREQERTFTAIVQELEAEKTGLNARVQERIQELEAELKSMNKRVERDEREKCYLARKAALGCFVMAHFEGRCSDCKFGTKDCKRIEIDDWLDAAKMEVGE